MRYFVETYAPTGVRIPAGAPLHGGALVSIHYLIVCDRAADNGWHEHAIALQGHSIRTLRVYTGLSGGEPILLSEKSAGVVVDGANPTWMSYNLIPGCAVRVEVELVVSAGGGNLQAPAPRVPTAPGLQAPETNQFDLVYEVWAEARVGGGSSGVRPVPGPGQITAPGT